MQDRSNGGKEYTVDEILKEYEDKDAAAEDTSAEESPSEDNTYNDAAEEHTGREEPAAEWSDGTAAENDAEDIAAAFALMDDTKQAIKDEGIVPELTEEPVTEEEKAAAQYTDEEVTEIFDDEPDTPRDTEKAADGDNTDETEDETEDEEEAEEDGEDKEPAAEDDTDTDGDAADEPPADSAETKKDGFWAGIIPMKGDSIPEIIRKIIFIVAVCVFVGAGIMLVSTLVQSRQALSDSDDIKAVVTTTVATTIDSDGNVVTVAPTEEEELEHNFDVMQYYKDINEDVVGYIQLEGCDIYQPVVQGEDNEYYLTHTYYKGSNKAGSIFMDYRCRVEEDYQSPNIVLYGHNQEDGTMFGNLKFYKQDVEFYAENPVITFNTEYGVGKYVIYAYFVTNALARQDSNGEVFHYHDYIETMNDEYTFNWYLKEVYDRTQIITPVDVEYGDQLLCLSTCSNEFSNSRFVVFARKLREDESLDDFDFTEAYINYNAQGVDWDAIMSAETTSEEATEETSKRVTGSAVTNADGEVLTDADGKKITIRGKKVKDENGEYVTDENGSNITTFGVPVFDEDGALVTNSSGAPVTSLPTSETDPEETTAVAETKVSETEAPETQLPEDETTSEKYSKTTRPTKRVDQTKKPATLPASSQEDTEASAADENGAAVTAVPETSAEETVTETAGADS